MARLARRFVVGCLVPLAWAAAALADGSSRLEDLAECIAESGAVFYGAHWCPYCRRQMEYFGPYASRLPYVECYEGRKTDGMTRECRSAGVTSFPTWHFPDGSVDTGAMSPAELAHRTGCS